MFAKFCLQLWCHLSNFDIIPVTIPSPTCMFYIINSSYTSDGVKPVSCPGKWKMLKYGNRSMEMEVWKRKYGSEKKAVYWRLVPYWLTTVPSQRVRRLFFSLPYFCFRTSVSSLQHFPLVFSCPVHMFLPKFGHETTTKVLDYTVNMLGVGL